MIKINNSVAVVVYSQDKDLEFWWIADSSHSVS